MRAFSIDDSSTTEIDDALSVTHGENGKTVVGVHIAVPALGIVRDDALDKVARARMSTVYAPGLKTTMLPEPWIEGYSLDEGRSVPCLSLYITVHDDTFGVEKTETRLERITVERNVRHDRIDELVTEEAIENHTKKFPGSGTSPAVSCASEKRCAAVPNSPTASTGSSFSRARAKTLRFTCAAAAAARLWTSSSRN